jgi:hypothetical protein
MFGSKHDTPELEKPSVDWRVVSTISITF